MGTNAEREVMGAWMLRRPMAEIVRGEGSWLVAADDKRFLDLTSGYGTSPLGHCHPKLVQALSEQAKALWAAPGFLLSESRRLYLEALRMSCRSLSITSFLPTVGRRRSRLA